MGEPKKDLDSKAEEHVDLTVRRVMEEVLEMKCPALSVKLGSKNYLHKILFT